MSRDEFKIQNLSSLAELTKMFRKKNLIQNQKAVRREICVDCIH